MQTVITAALLVIAVLLFALIKFNRTRPIPQIPRVPVKRGPPGSKLGKEQTCRLIEFLEKADDAYIRAYQYKSLGGLIRYTTKELAIETQQKITYRNDKIWGAPEHRRRTWTVISAGEREITVRKEITFKNVKCGSMLVKIGDDHVEYWKVVFDGPERRYKIREIVC